MSKTPVAFLIKVCRFNFVITQRHGSPIITERRAASDIKQKDSTCVRATKTLKALIFYIQS